MSKFKSIMRIIGEIFFRSFGLALKFLPVGLGLGGILSASTGNVAMVFYGALGAWLPALFEAYAEIGEEIALKAKVTESGIQRGFNKAVKIIEEQQKEQDKKNTDNGKKL